MRAVTAASLAALAAAALVRGVRAAVPRQTVVVRVTSADPAAPVLFDAGLVGDSLGAGRWVRARATPYEAVIASDAVHGAFRQVAGPAGAMRVEFRLRRGPVGGARASVAGPLATLATTRGRVVAIGL